MRVDVRAKGGGVTDEVRLYAWCRLRAALSRFSVYISKVEVSLSPEDNRHPGLDKECLVSVYIAHEKIVLNTSGATLEEALARASDRAQAAVARQLMLQSHGRRARVV